MLHLLSRLPWRKPSPVRRQPPRDGCNPPADERALGCGWFDSSHELVQGLVVREADGAALSALPLSVWLELELHRRSARALAS